VLAQGGRRMEDLEPFYPAAGGRVQWKDMRHRNVSSYYYNACINKTFVERHSGIHG
jgi:hypothetical protein